MVFFDLHCHVNLLDKALLFECEKHDINIVSVSTDIKSFNSVSQLINGGAKIYRQFLGYHPENITENNWRYVEKVIEFVKNNNIDGIGEIGLDFSKSYVANKNLQIKAFRLFLEVAGKKNIPVSIHSRNALPEVLSLLSEYKVKACLHWFSGSIEQLKEAAMKRYFIGFTPYAMKSSKYDKLLYEIPTDLICTESDAPIYNMTPLDMPNLIDHIAKIKLTPAAEMTNAISRNCKFFCEN